MNSNAFLFPGQGSQYVGMGKDIHDLYHSAREIFEKAEDLTGMPLKRLCFEGPMERSNPDRQLATGRNHC